MKKITFLFMLLTVTLGYSQSPTDNATAPPARNAGDVISIFSGEYTDVAGTDFNPNWGQSGFATADAAFDPGTGDLVLAYPNFNYQGNQYGSSQNISAMEFLHVDIWINGTFNPNVFVISSGGEIAHPITNTGAGSWISVDIPVSGITGDTSNAIQFKFDGGNGSTDAIYVDNLYFWKAATDPMTDATLSDLQIDGASIAGFGPGTTDYTFEVAQGTIVVPQITLATTSNTNANAVITQASAIPGTATVVVTAENGTTTETYSVSIAAIGPPAAPTTPPNRAAADVVSVYSNSYTTAPTDGFQTFGGAMVTEIDYSGNTIQAVTTPDNGSGLQYQYFGVSPQFLDLSLMSNMHIDFYFEGTITDVDTVILVIAQYSDGTNIQKTFNLNTLAARTWHEMDVAFADFNLNATNARDQIQQVIVQVAGPNGSQVGPLYFDNLYFHNNQVLSTESFETTEFRAYPNPTSGNWNISGKSIITNVAVYDILGKQVIALAPNATEAVIDASSLNSGIYFARINGVNGSKTVKLIKQ